MSILPEINPGTRIERHGAHIPLYKVLLHNDTVNTMDYVVNVLMRIFKFDRVKGEAIMLEAHREGVALCIVEPLEQAELHRDRLLSYSLCSSIEKE